MDYLCYMSKKLLAFIFLLSHINSTMLLPQVVETDVFRNGRQVDDINTIVEYIQQEILDITDDSPEDEDDDNGCDFKSFKFGDESCAPRFRFLLIDHFTIDKSQEFF